MSNYVLSGCSTADLSREHFNSRKIEYICFHYIMDGVERPDDLGQTMPFEEFYAAMVAGADTKTSQISAGEYIEYFEKFLADDKDVLHLSLSSGISGSYMSACAAAQTLSEKYPDRKIKVVDSLAASSGYGLILDKLADFRDSGMELDELVQWAEDHKREMHHWFFSSDLTFFVKGGRVSKTAGAIGGILGICPLLNVDNEGRLIPREKIRPKKKVIRRIVDVMKEHAVGGTEYNGKCYMCHSACFDDARAVADLVEAEFPNIDGKVIINNIGTTIGSHTGPGTVALFYWGDVRVD
ncbi:MAG: DegV family protein [Ruminococcaceae bacterium]|nr:DegV family protein [Oscillospiraceae bacterium]